MKDVQVFDLPYSVAVKGITNNIKLYLGNELKTKFQIFIELAFGLWCCMMLIASIKHILAITDLVFLCLTVQLWFFYLFNYIMFNQHYSRL